MSRRLWTCVACSVVAGGWALAWGAAKAMSLWPGVALFCLSGLLACVAACIDVASESAKHEAELDKNEGLDVMASAVESVQSKLGELEAKVDHLQKKDALNALG